MPTKQEMQAEIERLKNELAQKQDEGQEGIFLGQEYNTSMGLAKVVRFYEEDGHNKVQSVMRRFDPEDGLTLVGDEFLCSMPIELFKKRMSDFTKDQRQREQIAAKEARRKAKGKN